MLISTIRYKVKNYTKFLFNIWMIVSTYINFIQKPKHNKEGCGLLPHPSLFIALSWKNLKFIFYSFYLPTF